MSTPRNIVTRASSSRVPRPPVKADDGLFDGLTPLAPVSIPHSSSHSLASLEGDFGSSERVDPSVEIWGEKDVLGWGDMMPPEGMSLDEVKLFRSKSFFNCNSVITPRSTDLDNLARYCDFGMGYTYHFPQPGDCLWDHPVKGWQAIPMIFFELGFRLPMHPLFSAVFEVLGCGIAQLSPNAVAQITGVAALAHELKEDPTLELLFSLFRVKNLGGQLYLDKKVGRARTVNVRSSNSGWHTKWLYFEGPGLERIGAWKDVSKVWLKTFNHLPLLPDVTLRKFYGDEEKFTSEDFAKDIFLARRCSKICSFYSLTVVSVLCLTSFFFFLLSSVRRAT